VIYLLVQFHRDQDGSVQGSDGESACVFDDERANIDGWAEQAEHQVFCGEPGQGSPRTAVDRMYAAIRVLRLCTET
jgi:hypothetical protein